MVTPEIVKVSNSRLHYAEVRWKPFGLFLRLKVSRNWYPCILRLGDTRAVYNMATRLLSRSGR